MNGDETKTQTTPGKTSRPKRRRIVFGLVACTLAALLAVAISEVALRLFVDQEGKRLAVYDPQLGWRGRPDGNGVYIRSADEIRVPFHYNNLGFRDEDVEPKPANAQRLLLLGDSFVENLEVEYPQTFPAQLEQLLRGQASLWDVVVIGSQGYSTAQELLAFRKFGSQVDADVVLLCFFCGNDFDDNLRRKFAYLDERGELQLPSHSEPAWLTQTRRFQRWLYESSHLVYLVKNSLQAATNIELTPDSKATLQADEQTMRDITAKLLVSLADEVTQTGAKFGVVIIPDRDDLLAGEMERCQFISQVCGAANIAYLELSPLLDASHFFETDFHFNVAGHQIAAAAMDRFVLQLGDSLTDSSATATHATSYAE